MPDHNLSTSQRMVCPTVHDPFFRENSLYEAEADSGRSDMAVTSVTGPGCPPEFGSGFETDHGFIGSHFTAPVYTPRFTHNNYAFQDVTLTATTEGTASPQDSFTSVHPPADALIAISPGIPELDAVTTKWEPTVLPVAHDPSLTSTGHRIRTPLPMRRHIVIDDFFQPAMWSNASGEHTADDSVSIQSHQNVGNAAHALRHVNLKQWMCTW